MLAEQFQLLKELGSGTFGDVYLVRALQSDQLYACKIKKPNVNNKAPGEISDQDFEDLDQEVKYVSQMQNELIISIKAVGRGALDLLNGSKPTEVLYIIMDFVENGELFNIVESTGKFSEPTARYYFRQLLSAINYLHNTAGVTILKNLYLFAWLFVLDQAIYSI